MNGNKAVIELEESGGGSCLPTATRQYLDTKPILRRDELKMFSFRSTIQTSAPCVAGDVWMQHDHTETCSKHVGASVCDR